LPGQNEGEQAGGDEIVNGDDEGGVAALTLRPLEQLSKNERSDDLNGEEEN